MYCCITIGVEDFDFYDHHNFLSSVKCGWSWIFTLHGKNWWHFLQLQLQAQLNLKVCGSRGITQSFYIAEVLTFLNPKKIHMSPRAPIDQNKYEEGEILDAGCQSESCGSWGRCPILKFCNAYKQAEGIGLDSK